MSEFHGNQYTGSEYDDYEYEDLISDVRQLAQELGEPPTTRDAESDDRLPCLARMYDLIDDDWSTVLADAGVTAETMQVGTYSSNDHERMVADLRRANEAAISGTLTMRKYDDLGEFATSTVKKHFGSWKQACEAADIEVGTRHGDACLGPNGNRLDSRHELAVAKCLDGLDIEYDTHVQVGSTLWECDFYLPDPDLWIEVDGYATGKRPNKRGFARKLRYYASHSMDFVVVESPEELRESIDTK